MIHRESWVFSLVAILGVEICEGEGWELAVRALNPPGTGQIFLVLPTRHEGDLLLPSSQHRSPIARVVGICSRLGCHVQVVRLDGLLVRPSGKDADGVDRTVRASPNDLAAAGPATIGVLRDDGQPVWGIELEG